MAKVSATAPMPSSSIDSSAMIDVARAGTPEVSGTPATATGSVGAIDAPKTSRQAKGRTIPMSGPAIPRSRAASTAAAAMTRMFAVGRCPIASTSAIKVFSLAVP